jgi:carbonic anhydrase
MSDEGLTRRQLLAYAGIAAAATSFAAEPVVPRPTIHKESADALSRLHEENRRFADGKTRHAHESADWRKHLVGSHKPFATILGCSDSRVPIELVFD